MGNLVSIIVPVYNVAQYLDRCLSSLVKQTWPNLEILLVDDGSTDGSGALCDLWQSRDVRVRAFHKPNGGLSDARNYGLERATGEYIGFLDSDDWYDLRFVERMLGALTETGADVAECDFQITDVPLPCPQESPAKPDCRVFTGKECFHRFLAEDFFVSVCTKLYRRSLLENAPFRKGVYHEDEYWTYQIFSRAQKACRLRYTGYYYYQRQGSIVHTGLSKKRLTDAFQAAKERIDFIEQHYPEFTALGYAKAMNTCMYLFNQTRCSAIPEKAALLDVLRNYFRVLFRKYLRRGQYRKYSWRFFVFRVFPNAYCRLHY